MHIRKGDIADIEDKVTQVTGRIWGRRMKWTPAINAEAIGDQAEKVDTETVRPASICHAEANAITPVQ